ncbi:MAG: hypothetical protein WCF79_18700 [Rhodomicrobium sp.]|jgi:post-segregation antitoxin (ccd killing protein)
MRQNITIAVEQELLRKARVLAAQKGTSVSKLLSDELERLVGQADRYEKAKAEALADLNRGLRLGGQFASRDALYDR